MFAMVKVCECDLSLKETPDRLLILTSGYPQMSNGYHESMPSHFTIHHAGIAENSPVLLILDQQSSLLREAISELDTTCSKITFHASSSGASSTTGASHYLPSIPGVTPIHGKAKPVFRISGVGLWGTADVCASLSCTIEGENH